MKWYFKLLKYHFLLKEAFTINNFLGYKSIKSDLKELNLKFKIAIIIIAFVTLVLSFIDFNYFFNNSSSWFVISDAIANHMPVWKIVLLSLSGIANFTGIICIFLITFGRLSNFFWGTINVIIYGLFAFAWGYIGAAQLNVFFFLPFQIIGWYHWQKRIGVGETEVKMWEWRWYYVLVGAIIIGIIISVIFYFEIPWLSKLISGQYDYDNQVAPHLLDTLNTALSIIAMLLMIGGLREQWIFWIFVNITQIIMYSGITGFININMIILWTINLINAVVGLLRWYKIIL